MYMSLLRPQHILQDQHYDQSQSLPSAKLCHRKVTKTCQCFLSKKMTHDEPFQTNYIIHSIFSVPTCRLQNGGATMFPYRLCASPERELHHEVWWDLGCLQTSAYSPWWPAPSSLESEANRTYHSLIENRPYPNMKNGPRSIYRNSICQL